MSGEDCGAKTMGERLAMVRRAYGESIDLGDLGKAAFAALLGISPVAYEAFESGESLPSYEFLVSVQNRTKVSVAWLLGQKQSQWIDHTGDSDNVIAVGSQSLR